LLVIHPYGKIGSLPWESDDSIKVAYGALQEINAEKLLNISESIQLHTEQMENKLTMKRIHHAIDSAHNLIFLGFSYGPENLKLLSSGHENNIKLVSGTSFRLPEATVIKSKRLLCDHFKLNEREDVVRLRPQKCYEFLYDIGDDISD
jgi:hypothetical protein